MKAITFTRYGSPEVLNYSETERPEPGRGEVLVQIKAAALNASDLLAIGGKPVFMRTGSGLFKPNRTVPGADITGVVAACGPESKRWSSGDRVAADLSPVGLGGFADYITLSEDLLVPLPDDVSFESGAAAPTSAVTAYQALRETANVSSGDRVLIDGASGGVGTFAVQIAKALGAHVTAVCGASKTETAREIGSDVVIVRGESDPLESPDAFDVIYAVNGRRTLKEYLASLKTNGRFVMTGGSGSLAGTVMLQGRRLSRRTGRSVSFVSMRPQNERLTEVLDWIRRGAIRPVVDAVLPLSETIRGLQILSTGQARGKIIVQPGR